MNNEAKTFSFEYWTGVMDSRQITVYSFESVKAKLQLKRTLKDLTAN